MTTKPCAGEPDEIAGLVAYLARKESGYMTGSSLTIDGGMRYDCPVTCSIVWVGIHDRRGHDRARRRTAPPQ